MTENKYTLLQEIQKFERDAIQNGFSEKAIFSMIGALDKKYERSAEYELNINGIICNIGADLKYIRLLNYAAKRLRGLLSKQVVEKYLYDLGTTVLCIAELENPHPYKIQILISNSKFNEAKTYYERILRTDRYFTRAIINSSNILEKYGRNLESIYLYDEAIRINPGYGMALGNKAQAIEYYVRLCPSVSLRLIYLAYSLYDKALKDSSVEYIGGLGVGGMFLERKERLLSILDRNHYNVSNLCVAPESLSDYEKFCINKNLYLNYDFGYYYDDKSVLDNFSPSFIVSLKESPNKRTGVMSESVYFAFNVFNQILELYTTARLSYFDAITSDYSHLDKMVAYTYTYDYTKHSHKYGILKTVLSTLYNCLDKVAHLMHYYFVGFDAKGLQDIYFKWFLSESYKEIVIRQNDYQLLALRDMALDFEKGRRYYYLNRIRNRITHSFLNINIEIDYNDEYVEYEITESALDDAVDKMFLIVKAAIMYTVIALGNQNHEGKVFPMQATLEKDIFF